MEHDGETKEAKGVTRGQNVLYVLPHDEAAAEQFLAPALDRLESGVAETQLLIVTPDAESATALTSVVARLGADRAIGAVPATSARRAERLLRARTPQVVAGTPRELLALVQGTALKLEPVRVLLLAWADHLIDLRDDAEPLEALLAEVPKSAARIIVTGILTPGVEALVERYARRARRVGAEAAVEPAPMTISYATVSDASRSGALRRLLDELDPASGTVFVRSEASARVAGDVLRALGYGGDDAAVRVQRAGEGSVREVDVVLLYDIPATHAELAEAAGSTRRIVALAQPRQLGLLRGLAQGGAVTPLTLPDAAGRARNRERELREELRRVIQQSDTSRELLTLEPLLDQWDGIEIAAAALRLLEQARAAIPTGPVAASAAMSKLFINVGDKDGVRPGDLVGTLTNEGGISSAQVGRVEIRDTHTLVEVDAGVAEEVAQRITGKEIRGRRVQARMDRPLDRPKRDGERPRRDSSDRPPRREGGGPRSRSFGEGERPRSGFRERSERSDRGERSERPRRDFNDRPPRPRSDDQPRREGPDSRPRSGFRERPSFDRGERNEGRGRPPRAGGDDRSRRPASRPTRPRRYDE